MKAFTLCALPLLLLALLPSRVQAQCATPASARYTSATSTTATLFFLPTAGATGYTITYAAPGGSPQTVVPAPSGSPVVLSGLLPLTRYTVTVAANCAGGGTSAPATFTLLTLTGNDDPCGATPLPLSGATCQYTSSSTDLASTTVPNGYATAGCSGSGNPHDVWFTFTTASTGPASTGAVVSVQGASAGEIRLFSATSCAGPFTEITCSAGTRSAPLAPPLSVAGLLPATTYYVRINSVTSTEGPFRICVADPPACGTPIDVSIAPVRANSAQLNFRPGFNNSNYTITYQPTAGGATTTVSPPPSASPVLLTGLAPLTSYTATLQANCGGGGTGTLITRTFTTPPANDEPAGALPLPLLPTCQYTAGTTSQATVTRDSNGGFLPTTCGGDAGDVWFTMATAASGLGSRGLTLGIGTGGLSGATEVVLFESAGGAAGPFTVVGCSAQNSFGVPTPPLIAAALRPSTTYYVRVSGYSDSFRGPFSICASYPPACPAPTGLSVSAGSTLTSAFVAWTLSSPGDTYTVEYGPGGFTPGTGQTVTGISGSSTNVNNLTLGVYYEFYVTRDCSAAGNGSSTRLGPMGLQIQALANDDPCGAIALTSGGGNCVPVNATLVRAGTTTPNGYPARPCGFSARPDDVWFTFRTAATGPGSTGAAILVAGAAAGYLRVFSASSCNGPFTEIACAAEATQGRQAPPLVISAGLTPNTVYYISVGQSAGIQNGPFTICLTDPPACANPTNVQLGTFTPNNGSLTAPLTFTPAVGTTGYTVTYTAQGGTAQTLTPSASPVTLAGLLPSTNYTLTLQASCGGGLGSPITLRFTTTPINDLCIGALPIVCGQTVVDSSALATIAGDPRSTCNMANLNGPAIFYRFVGTGDDVVVSTCNLGTIVPTTLLVYTGTCTALTCVGGSRYDLSCTLNNDFTTVPFTSIAGTVYYIVVGGGRYADVRPFRMSLRCTPRGCAAPTAVVVSAVTAMAASVSFAPANAVATSYTATATPTIGSGASRSVSGLASPLALTGLTPDTPYSVCVTANCPAGVTSACSTPAVLLRTLLGSRNANLAAQVALFPNPAHRSATLQVPTALARQPIAVSCYDALGQQVRHLTLPAATADTQTVLDLTGLPAGVYTLRLTTAQGPLVKRLVLE